MGSGSSTAIGGGEEDGVLWIEMTSGSSDMEMMLGEGEVGGVGRCSDEDATALLSCAGRCATGSWVRGSAGLGRLRAKLFSFVWRMDVCHGVRTAGSAGGGVGVGATGVGRCKRDARMLL